MGLGLVGGACDRWAGPAAGGRALRLVGGAASPASHRRYQDKAVHFLQQNATAGAFPEVHLLGNCCILRCVGA